MNLTQLEAHTLLIVLRRVSGDSNESLRAITDGIQKQLSYISDRYSYQCSIGLLEHPDCKDLIEGNPQIEFKLGSIEALKDIIKNGN